MIIILSRGELVRVEVTFKNNDKEKELYEFLKSKNIDAEFVEAPGEHTWEFCDKHIKEFIKTL